MCTIVRVLSFLGFISFASSTSLAGVSPFDGAWKREWSNTTPRGVHQIGKRLVTIRTAGVSSELSTLTLTQTISGVTKTIRIVQSCKATKTDVRGRTLTIRWSELTLLSPKPSDIPPGLYLWTSPVTCTYTIHGRKLLVTTDKDTDTFYRVSNTQT